MMVDANEALFFVVVNHEEQYSIWPDSKPLPLGWVVVGEAAPKQICLDKINEIWIDMRPLSLRNTMNAAMNAQVVKKD